MKDILLPLYKINTFAPNPERVSKNVYKFYSDFDYDIIPEKLNTIKSGYYLKNILFQILPTPIYDKYQCTISAYSSTDSELNIDAFCFSKAKQDLFFAQRYKILEKNTCIFYLYIVSSSNEENYIFNIVNY